LHESPKFADDPLPEPLELFPGDLPAEIQNDPFDVFVQTKADFLKVRF